MLIIGERINGTRKSIREAIEKKDRDFIKKEIKKQIECGANYIDLNAGIGKGKEREKEDIKWLIECLYEIGDIPVCIDSSDPDVIDFWLSLIKNSDKIINSINGEKLKLLVDFQMFLLGFQIEKLLINIFLLFVFMKDLIQQ
jgi:5-methyltetrahydrofolate--homocysteine methyltransferase